VAQPNPIMNHSLKEKEEEIGEELYARATKKESGYFNRKDEMKVTLQFFALASVKRGMVRE
jgi:hypothetical protein